MMRYFRPRSLTWWAGVFLIAMGILQAAGWPSAWVEGADGLTGVLAALTGALTAILGGPGADVAPAALIGLGAGLIGLRDAMVRDRAENRARFEATMMAVSTEDTESVIGSDEPFDPNAHLPAGESPLPPGVVDPFGPGGSRE